MDGCFGFRVHVQHKTLTLGQCRVKKSTIAAVLGSQYVSAAAGGPVNVTLTDDSDSSEWQMQLTCDGVEHNVVNGLQPWLTHCNANIGEAFEILREANDSRIYVRLVRREVNTTASAPSGPGASQQQSASQHASMPALERATEGKAAAACQAEQHISGGSTAPVTAVHATGSQALPPAPAAATAPAECVHGAQAGPSMSEPCNYVPAAGQGARHLRTCLDLRGVPAPPGPFAGSNGAARYTSGTTQPSIASSGWRPSTLPVTYAMVAVPLRPGPVVRVPRGHGGGGGSDQHPPAADLWGAHGHPYGGPPFRPVDVNQRPLISNQQVPLKGVLGVQGMAEVGVEDGLRLRGCNPHSGHVPAAAVTAAGNEENGVAAGSGACGSVAAAVAAVRGYDGAPVGGASSYQFMPDCAPASSPLRSLPDRMGSWGQRPEGSEGVAGAEDASGWLQGFGMEGNTGGAACASADGMCRGGGVSKAAGLAAPGARPSDAGAGVAMQAWYNGFVIELHHHVAATLWPEFTLQFSFERSHEVLLHTERSPSAVELGQPANGPQQQANELRAYPVTLSPFRAGFRLTGVVAPAVRDLGGGTKGDVGLRRLPCGRVLLERWRQQGREGEYVQRAGAQHDGMPSDGADEGSDEEYAPHPKRRRLQGRAPGGSGTLAGLHAQGQQGASALGPQQTTGAEWAPDGFAPADVGTELCYSGRFRYNTLHLRVAAVQAFWPQQEAGLRRSPGLANSTHVTLHTCGGAPHPEGTQQASFGLLGQQHAVPLSYNGKSFSLSPIRGVLAALGLQGAGVLQVRRTPDGRVWAERIPTSAVTPAQQQQAPGFGATPSLAAAALATMEGARAAALHQPALGGVVASAPAAVAPAAGTTAAASPAFDFSALLMPPANTLVQLPTLPHAAVLAAATTSHPCLGQLQAPAASLVNALAAVVRLRVADMLRLRQLPDGQAWAAYPLLPAANPVLPQPPSDLAAAVEASAANTGGVSPSTSTLAPALQQPDPCVAAAPITDAIWPCAVGPGASIINTRPCPGELHAPATNAWDVPVTSVALLPPMAAARSLWPLEAAALEANLYPGHSAPVTLLTAACDGGPAAAMAGSPACAQLGGGEHGPAEQHTVLLHYTAATMRYEVKEAAGAIAALGLQGGGMLRLRWSTDGRVWAERALPPAANAAQQQLALALAASVDTAPASTAAAAPNPSTIASALQQADQGLAAASASPIAAAIVTGPGGVGDGSPGASTSYSLYASPTPSPDAPQPVGRAAEAASTATTTPAAPLCVSDGGLHLDRPTVAALWPECVDMPVGTQQLVRMRAVVEPGGGGNTAEEAAGGSIAGPRRSVTHYGTQLARLVPALWLLERTHVLLRELRLCEGDRVELVPLEGGVVGVRGAAKVEAAAAGQRLVSRDQAATAAAGQKGGGCGGTGDWAGEAGSSIGEAGDKRGQGVGNVPAASTVSAWLNGFLGEAYEEGLREDCRVPPGAGPRQQYDPQHERQEQQHRKEQDGEGMKGLDQEHGKEQQVHVQRPGQEEQHEGHVQQQERREEEQEQQEQVQQQDEQRLVQEQEAGGEQVQAQGPGEGVQGRKQDEVQRPQHHVGAAYVDTCLTRQRCVEQRSALPAEPEQVSQVPRLDTGQEAMQQQQRGEGREKEWEQRRTPEAGAASEACGEQLVLPQHHVPCLRQVHQQNEQPLRPEQRCTGVTVTAGSSATESEWEMGASCIRGHGQQQQQQRPAAAHLPASSLTPAHLHGCLPPGLDPPPLQPGELRLCGLTFHPDLEPGVRWAMADWEAGLGGTPLHEVEPEAGQVQVLGTGKPGAAAWGDAAGWSAALVQRYQLRPLVLTMELVRLLGLEEEEDWGRELPDHAPVRAGLEQRRDEQRGGWGLWATEALKKSHPIGVMGGYVMPAAAAKRFVELGWRDCSDGVKAEVRERVGGDGGRARVSYGWKLLASSYAMPYPAAEPSAQRFHAGGGSGGGASSSGSAAFPLLSMLGYGTPTALINDPRVNPRAWQHGHDVDADQEQLQANCGVVSVCVRGVVLPVLVALRDIGPGEQLLRDYGAAWWREVAGVWEVADDQDLAGAALLHGTGSNG